MNREEVVRPAGAIEREGLEKTLKILRERIGRLQEFADERGRIFAENISIMSAAEAIEATNLYDKQWFQECVFSDTVKALIAGRFIAAVSSYPYVDTSVWETITAREQPV